MKLVMPRSVTRDQAFMWTETPYAALWDHLRILQQPAAMAAILTGHTGSRKDENAYERELAELKANEISCLLVQADEYFQAADAVGLATRPLPLYYGMLSLAKAVIIAWKKEIRLADLRYHGLDRRTRSKDLADYEADPSCWTLGAEYACANEGVFQHFFSLLDDEELPRGGVFRLDDLLRTDAEISASYNRVSNFASKTYPLYQVEVSDNPYGIMLCPTTTDRAEFLRAFDCIGNDFAFEEGLRHEQALIIKSAPHVVAWPRYLGIQRPAAGGRYLVGPTGIEVGDSAIERYIRREAADFLSTFIMSSLVRYKVDFWVDIVRGDPRGNIGIVNLQLNACRRRFPHFVLDALYGEHFGFGTQARLG